MAWWIILMIRLSWTWICAIKVATWFLILASNMTTIDFGSANAWSIISSSLWICIFILSTLFLFVKWKEKWLGKISVSLFSKENSLLNGLNAENISLVLLSISTTGPLIFKHCLGVSLSNNNQWASLLFVCLNFRSNFMMWFDNRESTLSWDLLLSFCRWRWIGISLAIASILSEEDVWKALSIMRRLDTE